MQLLKQIFSHKMLYMFIQGVSAGLPYLLAGGTLSAWMTDYEVSLKTIGIFAFVRLPYTLKFLWSPLLDRYPIPFLGRRLGWVFVFQILLGLSIFTLGSLNPAEHLGGIAFMAVVMCFFSASQDIVIDAYRREVLSNNELGLGSSLYVNGYRVGMLIGGSLALLMADSSSITWDHTYQIIAGFYILLAISTIFSPKEDQRIAIPKSLQESVIGPLKEFFFRKEWLLIISFIFLYKIGDAMASQMIMPFYLKMGYTKTEIGVVAKGVGLFSAMAGGLIGGIALLKLGLYKGLWIFGILQSISTACFVLLVGQAKSLAMLSYIIGFENLASGMGTAAYAAFMASQTNKKYTATQYALLTSIMGVPMTVASAPTGWMAETWGWSTFFIACALIAIPGLLLLVPLKKYVKEGF